jgi:Ca2+-binding RTX toxin-like protein
MATIQGAPWDDKGWFALRGTENGDFIFGSGGNDELFGLAGNDRLDGGTGADFMDGGTGNDTYYVDDASDQIAESTDENDPAGGIDIVYSLVSYRLPDRGEDAAPETGLQAGDNRIENLTLLEIDTALNGTGNVYGNELRGNSLGNTLEGLAGNDELYGYDGVDTLEGGNDDDHLYGGNHHDVLDGGSGDDVLNGDAHDDTLVGRAGDDRLDGGTGADDMDGGAGNDYYYVDNAGDLVVEDFNEGEDTVYSSITYTLGANVEDLVLLTGAGAIDGTGNALANTIAGNGSDNELRGLDGEDVLIGGSGADTLRGGNQNDELHGQSGNDILRGDAGEDELYGGADDDDYFVNSAGDEVTESANEGLDAVFVSGLENYTLTAHVENLHLLTGRNGTGNGLGNTITGNLLGNIIDGAGGADTMEGRQGDDTYIVDQGNDIVREFNGEGNDTVRTSVNYTLGNGVAVETLRTTNDAGTASLELTGNELNNTLVGNDGGNILRGRGGSDGIDGRGGIDTVNYFDASGGVIVVLGQNGAPGFAYELGLVNNQAVIVSVDTLVNIENVQGSSQSDTLVGNEVVNLLQGFAGNDTYVVQNAGDTIMEGAGQGTDEARASTSYTLTAGAEVETLRTTDDSGTALINLTGNGTNNRLVGNNAGNTLDGGGGNNDELVGRDGNDTYLVNNANVRITENGGQGIDTVRTSVSYTLTAGADVEILETANSAGTAALNLTGNASGNIVIGNNGNNIITGGVGEDYLTGHGGRDSFLFNTTLDPENNLDVITDFNVTDDTIQLDNAVFTTLADGTFAAGQFVTGTAAQDAQDRIIYDSATGALFYDSDGTGGVAAIQFAEVNPGLALTNLDFLVV